VHGFAVFLHPLFFLDYSAACRVLVALAQQAAAANSSWSSPRDLPGVHQQGIHCENGTPHRTALTITGKNQRLKTSFPTTAFTVIAGRT
jgi:hypothetical protein